MTLDLSHFGQKLNNAVHALDKITLLTYYQIHSFNIYRNANNDIYIAVFNIKLARNCYVCGLRYTCVVIIDGARVCIGILSTYLSVMWSPGKHRHTYAYRKTT